MEQEDKNKLLRMIQRCSKVRKHKPKPVKSHVLTFGGVDAPLFADSEIKEKSRTRTQTDQLRKAMLLDFPD